MSKGGGKGSSKTWREGKFDGMASAAELLRGLDESTRARILGEMAEKEPEKAKALRGQMFLFEDLVRIPETSLQQLMKVVPQDTLILALRSASAELTEQFLSCVSTRVRGTLRADIAGQGPKPVGKVRAAQEKVVELARGLAAQGKIQLG